MTATKQEIIFQTSNRCFPTYFFHLQSYHQKSTIHVGTVHIQIKPHGILGEKTSTPVYRIPLYPLFCNVAFFKAAQVQSHLPSTCFYRWCQHRWSGNSTVVPWSDNKSADSVDPKVFWLVQMGRTEGWDLVKQFQTVPKPCPETVHTVSESKLNWLVVSTPLKKYARQIGSFPQVGVKMKNLWNHHLVFSVMSTDYPSQPPRCFNWHRFHSSRKFLTSLDTPLRGMRRREVLTHSNSNTTNECNLTCEFPDLLATRCKNVLPFQPSNIIVKRLSDIPSLLIKKNWNSLTNPT